MRGDRVAPCPRVEQKKAIGKIRGPKKIGRDGKGGGTTAADALEGKKKLPVHPGHLGEPEKLFIAVTLLHKKKKGKIGRMGGKYASRGEKKKGENSSCHNRTEGFSQRPEINRAFWDETETRRQGPLNQHVEKKPRWKWTLGRRDNAHID